MSSNCARIEEFGFTNKTLIGVMIIGSLISLVLFSEYD